MKLISKIDKVAAWTLACCFLLYMLTGFDIQKRFLSPQLSSLIHLKYLFIVAQVAFMYHTTFAIHLAIKRWHLWNAMGKSLLGFYLLINLTLIGLYISIHF